MVHHTDGRPEAYAFFGAATGLYLFYKGFQDLKLERQVADTAMSKVRSAAVGTVELAGRARLMTPAIQDPIYARDCCLFEVTVSKLVSSGKSSHWEVVNRAASVDPFFLEDETGSIAVYPAGAKLMVKKTMQWNLQQTFWLQFVEASGPEHDYARRFCPAGQVKVDATIVREGQPLFVLGFAAPHPTSPAAPPPTFEHFVHAVKADPARMKALALAQGADGQVSLEAWDAAVAGPIREQWERLQAAPSAGGLGLSVSREDGQTFLISDETQKELAWDLEWHSWLMILAGPALTIACVAYLAFSFGLL